METEALAAFEMREIQHHRGVALALGIIFVILGLLCLSSVVIATLVATALLGVLAIIGGVMLILSSFWGDGFWGALLRIALGLLLVIAGWSLLTRPVIGALTLTALMGWYFIISGALRLIMAVVERVSGWGWAVINGGIALLLGVLLLINWPFSGLVAIGLFLGVTLLIDGVVWVAAAVSARSARRAPPAPGNPPRSALV